MAVRNSLIFRSVFGDAEMMTRIRPVLAGQMALLDHVKDGVSYINRVWGTGNAYGYPANASSLFSVSNPGAPYGTAGQPLSWYIWAISGAPYLSMDSNPSDAAGVISALNSYYQNRVKGWFDAYDSYAAQNGVKVACYEGGLEITATPATVAAQTLPAMRDLLVDYLEYFFSKPTSDKFMYYALATNWNVELYGLNNSTASETTAAPPAAGQRSYKWDAVKQVIADGH